MMDNDNDGLVVEDHHQTKNSGCLSAVVFLGDHPLLATIAHYLRINV